MLQRAVAQGASLISPTLPFSPAQRANGHVYANR